MIYDHMKYLDSYRGISAIWTGRLTTWPGCVLDEKEQVKKIVVKVAV